MGNGRFGMGFSETQGKGRRGGNQGKVIEDIHDAKRQSFREYNPVVLFVASGANQIPATLGSPRRNDEVLCGSDKSLTSAVIQSLNIRGSSFCPFTVPFYRLPRQIVSKYMAAEYDVTNIRPENPGFKSL